MDKDSLALFTITLTNSQCLQKILENRQSALAGVGFPYFLQLWCLKFTELYFRGAFHVFLAMGLSDVNQRIQCGLESVTDWIDLKLFPVTTFRIVSTVDKYRSNFQEFLQVKCHAIANCGHVTCLSYGLTYVFKYQNITPPDRKQCISEKTLPPGASQCSRFI